MNVKYNKVNLCDSCREEFPECHAVTGDIIFGDGEGEDNICACRYYIPDTYMKREKSPCGVCEGLENGDTLYIQTSWDNGIGFDYIQNIEFCPVCGRRLL